MDSSAPRAHPPDRQAPFQQRAPLAKLVDHGFITPTAIHYVRNHGYVRRVTGDSWQLEISGAGGEANGAIYGGYCGHAFRARFR